jgi:hypothetical protein
MHRSLLATIVLAALCGAAGAQNFIDFDRRIAASVSSHRATVARVDAAVLDVTPNDGGAISRRLLLRALAVLEPLRSDPAQMGPDEADILKSVLDTINANRANDDRRGVGNALDLVGRAVWDAYAEPLIRSASARGLVALASERDGAVVRRWYKLEKTGAIAITELFAVAGRNQLTWAFTDISRRPAARTVGKSSSTSIPAKLVLLADVSSIGADGQSQGTFVGSSRLEVRVEETAAAVAACVVDLTKPVEATPAGSSATTASPGTSFVTTVAPSATPKATAPVISPEKAASECQRRHVPIAGGMDRAVLVDPRRALTVFDRPIATRQDLAAALGLAASLSEDWP